LKPDELAIVGSGIGGLAAAIVLENRGFSPLVFERASELKEVGAGLLLSPNGVAALGFIGVRDEVRQQSRVIREWRILNVNGKCIQHMRPIRGDLPAFSVHRADLQSILVRRINPSRLRLGHELMGYGANSTGINLRFVAQKQVDMPALIGADGLRSAVRATRFGQEALRYSGYIGWRGVASRIPEEYSGDFLSESWGEGKRFGISPMGNGRCYWYATMNFAANVTAPQNARAFLLELFAHWHQPVPELIESTPAEAILTNLIYDRPPRHPWSSGAVTLLGDAAHPMTPNLGQGACSALEDACVLATSLDRSSSFEEGFRKYERSRIARSDSMQRASNWLGKLIQLETPFATTARELCMRLSPSFLANASMRGIFSFTP
jgi:2-polyprenyl-6-methoxyphenol hydroxylase-like FAD-dependent oxidoreductase